LKYRKIGNDSIVLAADSINQLENNSILNNWKNDRNMIDGKLPSWESMRELQSNMNVWCYVNFHFLPSIVGQCMWLQSIQRGAKLRTLCTPSDEAFCLIVLKNNWELWMWECHNPNATAAYKQVHAPKVLYTSNGQGRRTFEFGGWSQDGIALYNTLVEELSINRTKLYNDMVNIGNGIMKSKMELLEEAFLHWAKIWDENNTLHLQEVKNTKRQKTTNDSFVKAVHIFGWKDCGA